MMKSTIFVIVSMLLALGGCSMVQKQEDVSGLQPYRSYVGSSYELKQEMHLSGVNAPPGYEDTVDYYVISAMSPGWDGPEVITRVILPTGTIIRVEAVYRCVNCLFEKPLKARVVIANYETKWNRPASIPLKYLEPQFAKKL